VTEASAISDHRPAAIGPGRLILVVGPSGAGKDTLIGWAAAACANDGNIVFPRRVVTREASPSEDNEQVSLDAFLQARSKDEFAVQWEAHGHCYALRRAYAAVTVVSITAPPDILAERLATRARSSDGQLADRLRRAVDDAAAVPDVTIINVGRIEDRAREFVQVIRGA
jgi:ribose 1,5-bisphosphokinase